MDLKKIANVAVLYFSQIICENYVFLTLRSLTYCFDILAVTKILKKAFFANVLFGLN